MSHAVQLRFVLLLAAISALTPFAIDMYLPAMPAIAADLGVSLGQVQASLSSFLLGFAAGQLLHGPLTDAWGRRPLLLAVLAVFALFSLLCALASSLEMLLLWRFGQALAGAGAAVVVAAAISDRYQGVAMIKARSLMVSSMTLAPLLAPAIGAAVAGIAGWRSLFVLLALVALANLVLVWRALPESLAERRSLHPWAVLASYRQIISTPVARLEFPALALISGAFFAFLAATPYLYMQQLGLGPMGYALAFAANVLALTFCSWLNSRLAGRVAPRWLLLRALGLQLLLSLLVSLTVALYGPVLWLHAPLWWLGVGLNGLIFANGTALVLERFRDRAGTAAAVLGASQFGCGALASGLVASASHRGPLAVVAVNSLCLALSLLLLLRAARQQRRLAGN